MKTRDAAAYELIKVAVEATISRAELIASDLDTLQRKKKEIISECKKIEAKRGRIIRHINRLTKYQVILMTDVSTTTRHVNLLTKYQAGLKADVSADTDVLSRKLSIIKPRIVRSIELSGEYNGVAARCTEAVEQLDAAVRQIDLAIRGRVLKKFAERLRAARKERGLTQGALADALGTTRDNISAYELGRNEPTISTLAAIAKFFGRPADSFLP